MLQKPAHNGHVAKFAFATTFATRLTLLHKRSRPCENLAKSDGVQGFGWIGDFPLENPDQTLDRGFWGPVGISEGKYGLIPKKMGSLYSLTAAINAGMPTRLIARRKL